jgi:zinc protease
MAPLAAPRQEEARLVLEDRVELPRIYMAWHSPALFAPFERPELDSGRRGCSRVGKTSRLYRALVFERRLATEVAASQNSREIGSFFQVGRHGCSGPAAGRARACDCR